MRSSAWYGGEDRDAYIHRAWMRRGNPDSAFDGRPQIAIINTASDLAPCNSHLDEISQSGYLDPSLIDMHAMKRFSEPDEIAAGVQFLLSTEASFITGEILTIDGGFSVNKIPWNK